MLRYAISGPVCILIVLMLTMGTVFAQGPATQDVQVIFSDAGEFSVLLQAIDDGGQPADPTFGTVSLDALDDVPVTLNLQLTYTDTQTERGSGAISVSATSFLPVSPVPPFAGSDQVEFQIPDRYLELTTIGEIDLDTSGQSCQDPELGAIIASTGAEGHSFDGGGNLKIAEVAAGCGTGSATQTIGLTLTVPAGVYPTEYSATITVETTVGDIS